MAGKTYTLKLSPLNETYEGHIQKGNQLVESDINRHDEEVSFLQFVISACEIKDKKELIRYLDTCGRFDNLDEEIEVDIDQEESDWLQKGLEKAMENKRPYWRKIRGLIAQIVDPQEKPPETPIEEPKT